MSKKFVAYSPKALKELLGKSPEKAKVPGLSVSAVRKYIDGTREPGTRALSILGKFLGIYFYSEWKTTD